MEKFLDESKRRISLKKPKELNSLKNFSNSGGFPDISTGVFV